MPSTATQQQPTPEQVAAYARLEQARAAYREMMSAFDRRTGGPEEGAALQIAYDAASKALETALYEWYGACTDAERASKTEAA